MTAAVSSLRALDSVNRKRGAVSQVAASYDVADGPGVADIVERVRVQDDQIGSETFADRPPFVLVPNQVGGVDSRRRQCLARGQAC